MTNAEKYKTPRERADAFKAFCEGHDCKCSGCPLDCSWNGRDVSMFEWLDLEGEVRHD